MMTSQKYTKTNIDKAIELFPEFPVFFQKLEPKLNELKLKLSQATDMDYYNWLDFAYLEKVNQDTKAIASKIKAKNFKNAFVIGMGGSGINALVLKNALYEFRPKAQKNSSINVIVQNNLDPVSMRSKLESIEHELDQTLFLLISKSGNTDEVKRNISTSLNFIEEKSGLDFAKLGEQLCIITEPKQNGKQNLLHDLRQELKDKSNTEVCFLENDPNIGGRFSMFSPVGMLPAELMGLDSDALLRAAKTKYQEFLNDASATIAEQAALDIFLSQEKSFSNRYSMVYSDSLDALNKFRAQLKGESLCKNNIASTIHIAGVGTVNHHSDLELLLKNNNGVILEQIFFEKTFTDHINQASLECLSSIQGQSNYQSLLDNHVKPLANYMHANNFPVVQTIITEQTESALAELLMQDMLCTVVQAGLQDEIGKFDKLDLVIRQYEVESYKSQAKKTKA